MPKVCCFIGHSQIWSDIFHALTDAVERHIAGYGVTDFLVGNYGQFDRMATAAVKRAKEQRPDIRLHLMLPYRPERGRPLPDMEGCDNAVYPLKMEGVHLKVAIPRLNRIMVEDASYAIAYVMHAWGGAAKTLEYAQVRERKGLIHIENLAEKAEQRGR